MNAGERAASQASLQPHSYLLLLKEHLGHLSLLGTTAEWSWCLFLRGRCAATRAAAVAAGLSLDVTWLGLVYAWLVSSSAEIPSITCIPRSFL
jgi:hypothetical protein